MKAVRFFGRAELPVLDKALVVAEESVGDLFRLSDAFWKRHPYDLRTLAGLSPQEVSPVALAQVIKLRRPPGRGSIRSRDFFRVCLQDHNVISLLEREGDGDLFLPLMTYILAHELVHLVRFNRFEHLYEAGEEERNREEEKVNGLTVRALSRAPLPHLNRVINLYEEGGAWALGVASA